MFRYVSFLILCTLSLYATESESFLAIKSQVEDSLCELTLYPTEMITSRL